MTRRQAVKSSPVVTRCLRPDINPPCLYALYGEGQSVRPFAHAITTAPQWIIASLSSLDFITEQFVHRGFAVGFMVYRDSYIGFWSSGLYLWFQVTFLAVLTCFCSLSVQLMHALCKVLCWREYSSEMNAVIAAGHVGQSVSASN